MKDVTPKTQPLAVPAAAADEDAQMGAQLTAQYRKAVSGMQEVVIFGAMMLVLREKHPEMKQIGGSRKAVSTRGHCSEETPLSLQKWLEKYAPEVKRPTALRFLAVTESIAAEYPAIVGAKVAKQFSLQALVTTPKEQLPQLAAAKQLSLFEFVNGTSQRSWLDAYLPAKDSGGKTYERTPGKGKGAKKPTAEQLRKLAEAELADLLSGLNAFFKVRHHTRLDAEKRKVAESVLEGAVQKFRTVAD